MPASRPCVDQLGPHFLFNTLNAVSTLIAEGEAEDANRMLGRLARFLRSTLDETGNEQVPLARELSTLNNISKLNKSVSTTGWRSSFWFPTPPKMRSFRHCYCRRSSRMLSGMVSPHKRAVADCQSTRMYAVAVCISSSLTTESGPATARPTSGNAVV
jgi:Histidine kinase